MARFAKLVMVLFGCVWLGAAAGCSEPERRHGPPPPDSYRPPPKQADVPQRAPEYGSPGRQAFGE